MKKILIALAVICVLLTGCSKADTPAETVDVELSSVMENVMNDSDIELPMTMPVEDEMLQDMYGLSDELVSDYAIALSAMNVHATEIIMVKAQDGKLDDVKAALDQRMTDVENLWSTYLPEQYEMVKDRKTLETGNIVVIVIADQADEIMEIITDSLTASK